MRKFDMTAAWNDSLQLMRAHSAFTLVIAAVFFFLPALAFAWFGPAPIAPPSNASLDHLWVTWMQNMEQSLLPRLAMALVALVGSAAILRLWLARGSVSVGDALAFALTLFPTMVAIEFTTNVAIAGGLILLILPGCYLIGRLAAAAPAAVDRRLFDPFAALRTSWALTKGMAWQIFLFVLGVAIALVAVSLIFGVVAMAFTGDGNGAGRLVGGAIEAAVIAANGFVSLAVSAAIYRQLATSDVTAVFD